MDCDGCVPRDQRSQARCPAVLRRAGNNWDGDGLELGLRTNKTDSHAAMDRLASTHSHTPPVRSFIISKDWQISFNWLLPGFIIKSSELQKLNFFVRIWRDNIKFNFWSWSPECNISALLEHYTGYHHAISGHLHEHCSWWWCEARVLWDTGRHAAKVWATLYIFTPGYPACLTQSKVTRTLARTAGEERNQASWKLWGHDTPFNSLAFIMLRLSQQCEVVRCKQEVFPFLCCLNIPIDPQIGAGSISVHHPRKLRPGEKLDSQCVKQCRATGMIWGIMVTKNI